MPWPVHPNGLLGAQGDNDAYRIERSLRFNSADSTYLSRTPSSTSTRRIMTVSAWVKISSLQSGAIRGIYSGGTGNFWDTFTLSNVADDVRIFFDGGNGANLTSSSIFRDLSAWYHFVFSVDTTQATASNRVKFFVNGIQQTLTGTQPVQNYQFTKIFNSSYAQYIGATDGGAGGLNGYIAEFYAIDGQALTPSSFGETDAITGRWKAKAYSGTYGTNGFYLNFSDNSGTTSTTLGKDNSGNSNNWTPNNFSVDNTTGNGVGNDSLVDSPTNYGADLGNGGEVRGNYCTFNPLKRGSTYGNLSNGNLTIAGTTGAAGQQTVQASIGMSSGKWYAEAIITTLGAESAVGIARITEDTGLFVGANAFSYGYYYSGSKYNNNSASSYGSSYTSGDVIGVAFDANAGNLVFYKNGVSQGTAFTGLTNGPYVFEGQGRSATSANNNSWNFGQRPWKYTAPTGYKALCTTNLPQPAIQKPSKYMDAVTYTGTGASNSISSLGFSPDLVWIKNRGAATSHAIYDTTRGVQQQLSSDTTGNEITSSTGLTAFGSNGFTIGTSTLVNTSGTQYVGWAWDEASIAGMDIVSYVGDGSAGKTISHNLGVAPKLVIVKNRTTAGFDWVVYHQNMNASPQGGYLSLNATYAFQSNTTIWNNVAPSSSFVTLGTNTAVNKNGDNHIAYCFAEVEGFSKFGSFAGLNSTDGAFALCGFMPKLILVKKYSATGPWMIFDSARDTINVGSTELRPNETSAEPITARGSIDILSNGFKIRSTSATYLGELGDFIFAAFAESPFKYARAR